MAFAVSCLQLIYTVSKVSGVVDLHLEILRLCWVWNSGGSLLEGVYVSCQYIFLYSSLLLHPPVEGETVRANIRVIVWAFRILKLLVFQGVQSPKH